VPLVATGVQGEAVAGIRYRARRLYAALHPTIPVHTPLIVDLIDTRSGCSIAHCTYFAGPPDGSVHTTRPSNAAEAKARRLERFVVSPPPTQAVQLPAAENNPEFPMTLDMRWVSPYASDKRSPMSTNDR
jgi:uncharacterized protein (DUF2126 family)